MRVAVVHLSGREAAGPGIDWLNTLCWGFWAMEQNYSWRACVLIAQQLGMIVTGWAVNFWYWKTEQQFSLVLIKIEA
jgi:hypothetical protein